MSWFLSLIVGTLLLAILLACYRIWKGPNRADRILIFDLLAVAGISLMLVCAVYFNSQLFLDVSILMALIAFAGTIGFTYFLEKEGSP